MQDFGILSLCRMKIRGRAWRFELSFTTEVEMVNLANANVKNNTLWKHA